MTTKISNFSHSPSDPLILICTPRSIIDEIHPIRKLISNLKSVQSVTGSIPSLRGEQVVLDSSDTQTTLIRALMLDALAAPSKSTSSIQVQEKRLSRTESNDIMKNGFLIGHCPSLDRRKFGSEKTTIIPSLKLKSPHRYSALRMFTVSDTEEFRKKNSSEVISTNNLHHNYLVGIYTILTKFQSFKRKNTPLIKEMGKKVSDFALYLKKDKSKTDLFQKSECEKHSKSDNNKQFSRLEMGLTDRADIGSEMENISECQWIKNVKIIIKKESEKVNQLEKLITQHSNEKHNHSKVVDLLYGIVSDSLNHDKLSNLFKQIDKKIDDNQSSNKSGEISFKNSLLHSIKLLITEHVNSIATTTHQKPNEITKELIDKFDETVNQICRKIFHRLVGKSILNTLLCIQKSIQGRYNSILYTTACKQLIVIKFEEIISKLVNIPLHQTLIKKDVSQIECLRKVMAEICLKNCKEELSSMISLWDDKMQAFEIIKNIILFHQTSYCMNNGRINPFYAVFKDTKLENCRDILKSQQIKQFFYYLSITKLNIKTAEELWETHSEITHCFEADSPISEKGEIPPVSFKQVLLEMIIAKKIIPNVIVQLTDKIKPFELSSVEIRTVARNIYEIYKRQAEPTSPRSKIDLPTRCLSYFDLESIYKECTQEQIMNIAKSISEQRQEISVIINKELVSALPRIQLCYERLSSYQKKIEALFSNLKWEELTLSMESQEKELAKNYLAALNYKSFIELYTRKERECFESEKIALATIFRQLTFRVLDIFQKPGMMHGGNLNPGIAKAYQKEIDSALQEPIIWDVLYQKLADIELYCRLCAKIPDYSSNKLQQSLHGNTLVPKDITG